MHFENLHPPGAVGAVHQHLPVETARAQQRRVEDFGPVRCGQQNDALGRIETVEFGQKLVQRLLAFVMAPAGMLARGAGPAKRVQFVHENDGRRCLPRLLEEVAYPRGADAHEHLHEFRAGYRVERHARLAGNGLGQQRLAGAGRADEKHALGHPRAQAAVMLGVLQELDDLFKFLLGLVHARHIVETDLGVALDIDLGLALADRHEAAHPLPLGELADEENPDADEDKRRQHPG